MGIICTVDGHKVKIGNRKLMLKYKLKIKAKVEQQLSKFESLGKTSMLVAVGDEIVGTIAVADSVRPEARDVIDILKKKNIGVWMITGDNKKTATAIAEELGIEFVFAEVSPKYKKDKIQEIQKQGFVVAMVGDGINDSPALVQADVGIAIGAGTDIAIEAADIVLMKSNLVDVLIAIDISQRTYGRIKINFIWAFVYNFVAIPIAAGLFFPLIKMSLPPWMAGLAMALSSISVVLSSLWLKLYKPPKIIKQLKEQ